MSIVSKRQIALPPRRASRRRGDRLALKPGRIWKSWEQFRRGGQEELTALQPGEVGQLLVRNGSYRVVRETDFQEMYGLARDVERLQNGLRVIVAAARSARQHRDETTVHTLLEAVTVLADIPSLPSRPAESAAPEPEGLELSEDDFDGIELDPATVRRPYADRAEE